MTHEWVYDDTHTLALWDKLCATNPEEAELFPFDVRQIQWDRYTMVYSRIFKNDSNSVELLLWFTALCVEGYQY